MGKLGNGSRGQVDPLEAVALGAARHAGVVAGQTGGARVLAK